MSEPPNVVHARLPVAFRDLYRPARYKVYYGGRSAAKSRSIGSFLVEEGARRPIRVLCCREIQRSLAASVYQLLVDAIRDLQLSAAYKVTRDSIRGANGTIFLFSGLRTNPASIKSMEDLDYVWVAEADRVSQESLDFLIPTARKPGSELLFDFNRNSPTDPVDAMFLGADPPPDSIIRKVTWRDNPFLPRTSYETMLWMRNRDPVKYQNIWEGHPVQHTNAQVFSNWVIDDLDKVVPKEALLRFGADWGFATDPTVLIGGYYWDRTFYIRHERWKVGCAIDEIPSLFAGTDKVTPPRWRNPYRPGAVRHEGVPGAAQGLIIADSARPETVAYLRERGFNIRGARKGSGSVKDGVEFLQNCDIVIHPSCEHAADEFRLYSYRVDKRTEEVTSELADAHNHVIDSARYALETVRRRTSVMAPIANTSDFGPILVRG